MIAQLGKNRRRGEPLFALALLMAAWMGARVLLWDSPFPSRFAVAAAASAELMHELPTLAGPERTGRSRAVEPPKRGTSPVSLKASSDVPLIAASATGGEWSGSTLHFQKPLLTPDPPPRALAAGHDGFLAQPGTALPLKADRRWHLGAWVAWRSGSGLPRRADGAHPASYGGTQVGAVARFDLATGGHRPALHLRTTYAPDRPRQAEIATGAGLRPLPRLPMRTIVEVRATHSQGLTEIRPAVLAVTELDPINLLLDLKAEGYGQAGWVGGRYATAFADGQARLTRQLVSSGQTRLHVGAGAWGGAQRFVERVDVGPTIGLDLDAGPAVVRLTLDYRVRVAGNASPGDGAALTLSTGF